MGQLAVVVVPPPKDMIEVEDVRRRFDHLADAIPAHVTLVFPFEAEAVATDIASHVRDAAKGFRPFALELRGVMCSWNHYLFLLVDQDAEEVRALHDRLYKDLPQMLLSNQEFTPHITVGRFGNGGECAAAMSVIEPMKLRVRTKAASLRVYDSSQIPYRVICEAPLAQNFLV